MNAIAQRKGKTEGIALRQRREPVPMLQVVTGREREAATAILWRLDELHRSRGCGAFLFVDPLNQVYVVCEEAGAAVVWERERAAWFRGLFRAGCGVDVLLDELALSPLTSCAKASR